MIDVYEFKDTLFKLSDTLWDLAEVRYEETGSAKAITNILQENDFEVTVGCGGLPTAFRACYGRGKPVIGLLAEYDALDGLSQQADVTRPLPREETTHGHGCGHHLLGSGVVGAALAIKKWLQGNAVSGTLVVLGCPAEEGGSGKTYMARAGVFDDLDVALTWHPSTVNAAMTGSLLANCQAYFRFHGKSSHAGAAPHMGRSALDALELMNVGVNYLREHMAMTDRIHYSILNTGGTSPNVVQAEAEALYLIRSKDNESVKELYHRVCNIAQGAALMTGTAVEIEFDNAVSNVIPSDTLGQLMYDTMCHVGIPEYTEKEKQYINSFRSVLGKEAAAHDLGMLPAFDLDLREQLCREHPMGDFIIPFEPQDIIETASSDMGDVSQIVPLIQLQCSCFCLGTPPHSWPMVAQGKSGFAHKGMLFAAQVLAEAAEKLYTDNGLLQKAIREEQQRTGGKKYVCPIPPEIVPPAFRK